MNLVGTAIEDRLGQELADLRRPLMGFCYRMLGSSHDAEDAVQETIMRAWRGLSRLDDPSGLRPWVFRIATNVCIDAANGRRRRALPMDITAPDDGRGNLGAPLPEAVWISPIPTWKVDGDDPADRAVSNDSIRLAFVAALQHLAPRQRAVLILRDVLRWRAAEVAALLETSVDAVNSSLRRARAALAEARRADPTPPGADPVDPRLVQRYIDAFARYDIDGVVALLHHDVVVSMPPFPFWLRGRDAFGYWLRESGVCGHGRMVPTAANGSPAVGLYRPDAGSGQEPSGLHVLTVRDGRIASLHVFLDPALFDLFGLPRTAPDES